MKHHTEEHVNKEIDSKETINIVIEPHNHRAIIGFDKNGIIPINHRKRSEQIT